MENFLILSLSKSCTEYRLFPVPVQSNNLRPNSNKRGDWKCWAYANFQMAGGSSPLYTLEIRESRTRNPIYKIPRTLNKLNPTRKTAWLHPASAQQGLSMDNIPRVWLIHFRNSKRTDVSTNHCCNSRFHRSYARTYASSQSCSVPWQAPQPFFFFFFALSLWQTTYQHAEIFQLHPFSCQPPPIPSSVSPKAPERGSANGGSLCSPSPA